MRQKERERNSEPENLPTGGEYHCRPGITQVWTRSTRGSTISLWNWFSEKWWICVQTSASLSAWPWSNWQSNLLDFLDSSRNCACFHAQWLSPIWLCNPMGCCPPDSSVHGTSQQEYWSGLPLPPPGYLLYPRIEPASPALQVDSFPLSHLGSPQETVEQLKNAAFDFLFIKCRGGGLLVTLKNCYYL